MATAPQFVGRDLGASDWVAVDQDRIDAFAACTGDRQWIHVDVERAGASPFGAPIAHGYLSLSLVAAMVMELGVIRPTPQPGSTMGWTSPLHRGQGGRARAHAREAPRGRAQSGGRVLLKLNCTLEIEGEAKPALVAELLCLLIGGDANEHRRITMATAATEAVDDDIREQAAQHTLAANPLVGVRGQDILDRHACCSGRC